MSLYAEYIKERLGDEIIERDDGFATYRFIDDNGVSAVYLIDIYVRPEAREKGIAREMADDIVEKGKESGCSRFIGSVSATSKTATQSIKVLISYGLEFYQSGPEGLLFKKEI